MAEWRMEGDGSGRIHRLQLELFVPILDLGNTIETDFCFIAMHMGDDAIGGFFVNVGSWRVAAYDKQLLVRGATKGSPDRSAHGELVKAGPIKLCMLWESAKRHGELSAPP